MTGRHQGEIETPALCLDLDALEANAAALASLIGGQDRRWRWRTACCGPLELAQLAARGGAEGIATGTLSAAECFIAAGAADIRLVNKVVGAAALARLGRLCPLACPLVTCDHYAQAEAIASLCRQTGLTCRVLIELNAGLHRSGVRPGSDARDLARGAARLAGIELAGITGDLGEPSGDPAADRKRVDAGLSLLEELRDQLYRDGLPCGIVSAAGNCELVKCSQHRAVTEVECPGLLGDDLDRRAAAPVPLQPALHVVSTVVSRPKLERAVLDAGLTALGPASPLPKIRSTAAGRELGDIEITHLGAETMTVSLGPQSRDLIIGDAVVVIPAVSTLAMCLHPVVYAIRGGVVEAVWRTLR